MTRSELIERISALYPHLYKMDVERMAMTIVTAMRRSLAVGRKIELRDFGIFGTKFKQAYVARNPKNGERVDVPPRSTIYFHAGKELKRRMNQK